MTDTIIADLKETVAQLDANRPDVRVIDHGIYDMILNNTDFTKCKTTQQSMNKFYEQLWMHVIFPLQDDCYSKDREIGRILCDWITEKKQKEKYKEELDTLRESLQGEGKEGAE